MNKQIGISRSTATNWIKWGYIPIVTQLRIQKLTEGALKADLESIDREIEKERPYEFSKKHRDDLLKEQNGKCAICRKEEKTSNYRSNKKIALSLDHNHKTNLSRGLLCGMCNRMIGFSQDCIQTLQNAVTYLKKHQDKA